MVKELFGGDNSFTRHFNSKFGKIQKISEDSESETVIRKSNQKQLKMIRKLAINLTSAICKDA